MHPILTPDEPTKLAGLPGRLEEFAESHGLSIKSVFSDDFIRRHSRFTGLQVMLDSVNATNVINRSSEDHEWDLFVAQFTDFRNLQELFDGALELHKNTMDRKVVRV